MKKLEATIEPSQLAAVKKALLGIGIDGMTVSHVYRHGSESGSKVVYRGQRFNVDLLSRVRFDLVVADERVNDVVDAIAAVTPADNRILLYDIAETVRNASASHRTAA